MPDSKQQTIHFSLLVRIFPACLFQASLTRLSRLMVVVLAAACLLLALALALPPAQAATRDDSSFGLTNYAFASYLGTGFYSTTGQNVFVLQMPFEYQIREMSEDSAGWLLTLPVTIGFINFNSIDQIDLPNARDVGTITFLPGIQYQYPLMKNWRLLPFVDYGYARDLGYSTNILINGAGIKSYIDFEVDGEVFTLGNRFLYAREQSGDTRKDSDYSLIETGINYRMNSDYSFSSGTLYTNVYYINMFYPNNLVFLDRTDNPIRVGVEHEIGVTFSNIPKFWFFEDVELGLGIRFGNEVEVYRLVFGAPF